MYRVIAIIVSILLLSACNNEASEPQAEQQLRGLKTIVIKETEETTIRRYPSVLQPASTSVLSFEISGRLKEINLDVGQRVSKSDLLAEIDTRSLDLQVETSKAAVSEVQSRARTANEDQKRKETLFEKGLIANNAMDQARTEAETTAAQVIQAQRSLDTALENLTKATLSAPFDGILNTVEVQSFTNVTAGSPVATLYATDSFESSFSVSYDIVNRLAVGKHVTVRLADNPTISLKGHIAELGARADTVSSFPVVVKLDETNPSIKAGMAVEISMEFPVPTGQGFSLPLSVLPFDGKIKPGETPDTPGSTSVFVYNPQDSTVNRQTVRVGGVRENAIIIVDGLKAGDQVASAGVSFLREGQKVKLLSNDN